MGDNTGIEWTDATWNPIVGCSVVSPGCTNCYAMKMAARIESIDAGQRMRAFESHRSLDERHPEGRDPARTALLDARTHYAGTTQATRAGAVWTGKVALAPDATLLAPLRWRRPRRIFVNSMGDLFHESVPDDWIDRVFAVMALSPQHTFQVLTKRSKRMRAYFEGRRANFGRASDALHEMSHPLDEDAVQAAADRLDYFDSAGITMRHVWLGVSAEDQVRADERIPDLLATPAAIRFVSAEPLLGPIDLGLLQADLPINAWLTWLDGLHWIIAGGESGPHARPMHPDWARSLRNQCTAAGVPFFFKQHGEWIGVLDLRLLQGGTGPGFGAFDHCRYDQDAEAVRVGKKVAGRLLDGSTHDAMPKAIA